MNILLGVTGSVAALKTPELHAALMRAGHAVKIVATRAALYFFDPEPFRQPERVLFLDDDEWPGRDTGRRWQRDEPVLHIELRRWAELLLVAPLDANTLAKLAGGLCDNCLTCVWRAWDPARPVVLAPAMNTLMWQHPLTGQHLRQLAGPRQAEIPARFDQDGVVDWLNQHLNALRVVPPQSKRLACGDIGMGALAELERIVEVTSSFPSK
ncbi:MAG: flavoprotein [Gemmataceae bacterium]